MEPSMTHPAKRCINMLLNLQNKLDKREGTKKMGSSIYAYT
jgi:hypothetical protein